MDEELLVERRVRALPTKLRGRGLESEEDARTFLARVLAEHPSAYSAAKELHVTRETLRLWMRRFRIRIVTAP